VILTVTLNPAWDITHTIEHLEPGATHRADGVTVQPGGKGINVSRVLHRLGYPTLAAGVVSGLSGYRLRAELATAGIAEACFSAVATGETRRTVTIVETRSGRATVLSEPGPVLAPYVWPAVLRHLDSLLVEAKLAVFTGSLPPGVPTEAYRVLVERAHARGVPAIVDADCAALACCLPARPDLVKPNIAELRAVTGRNDPLDGGRRLLAAGAGRVVVSDGPAGLTGMDAMGAWRAVPATLRPVNPTGAGDAAVAALAVGLLRGDGWPEHLRTAAAWSAAAVVEPRAGAVAADRIADLARTTTVGPLGPDPVTDPVAARAAERVATGIVERAGEAPC